MTSPGASGGSAAADAERRARVIGAVALLFGLFQVANHFRRGEPWENLFACNLSPFFVAGGCFALRPRLLALGVSWLAMGTLLWLTDVATGGELLITGIFSHIGVFALGVTAARSVGWPERAWIVPTAAMPVLIGMSRLIAPPATNLNLAFAVWKGWEGWFPNHAVYLLFICSGCALGFVIVDQLLRRFVAPPADAGPQVAE